MIHPNAGKGLAAWRSLQSLPKKDQYWLSRLFMV